MTRTYIIEVEHGEARDLRVTAKLYQVQPDGSKALTSQATDVNGEEADAVYMAVQGAFYG